MRKLILLVCVTGSLLLPTITPAQGLIPSFESSSGQIGFYPISNEVSYYKNYDDSGEDRGTTLQIIAINGFKLFTEFSFEFTADYNFDLTPGLDDDHYVELSLVKPVTSFVSVNYQRVIATLESESINQFGVRFTF
ncbi:MAG: hypothetical protein GY867_00190 [bacterium]|nr:hypothetical protein [bacterium]